MAEFSSSATMEWSKMARELGYADDGRGQKRYRRYDGDDDDDEDYYNEDYYDEDYDEDYDDDCDSERDDDHSDSADYPEAYEESTNYYGDNNNGVEEEDDYEKAQEETLREWFIKFCLRIARNDATLMEFDDLIQQALLHGGRYWNDSDLMLLGKALASNTHLETFAMAMPYACPCSRTGTLPSRGTIQALCQGVATSQLQHLKLKGICCHYLPCLVEGAGLSPTLQTFSLTDTSFKNNNIIRDLAKHLLLPSSQETPSPHHPSESPCTMKQPYGQLTQLRLADCDLNDMEVLTLSLALADNRSLLKLNLENNYSITSVGVLYLCQHWTNECPLRELDLSRNQIGSTGVLALLEVASRNPAVHSLKLLGKKSIGYQGLASIGDYLANNNTQHLQYLDISSCANFLTPTRDSMMTTAAFRALANGLRHNTSLVDVRVGGTFQLGPQGATMLMRAVVGHHPSLQMISFALDDSIGLAGVQQIGNLLLYTDLKGLNLDLVVSSWPDPPTKQSRQAWQALFKGVQHNVHLTEFSCMGLDPTWLQPIQFHVDLNKTCRPLLENNAMAPSVWSHVLAKYSRQKNTMSYLFFCLREQPWLMGGGDHHGASFVAVRA